MPRGEPADQSADPLRVPVDGQPPGEVHADVVPGRYDLAVPRRAGVPGRRYVRLRAVHDGQRHRLRPRGFASARWPTSRPWPFSPAPAPSWAPAGRSQMMGIRLATGLVPSNVTRSAAPASSTNASTAAWSRAVKCFGRYTPVSLGTPRRAAEPLAISYPNAPPPRRTGRPGARF